MVELIPAYGKEYLSFEEAKADWDSGIEFILSTSGRYCTIKDLRKVSYYCGSVHLLGKCIMLAYGAPCKN